MWLRYALFVLKGKKRKGRAVLGAMTERCGWLDVSSEARIAARGSTCLEDLSITVHSQTS